MKRKGKRIMEQLNIVKAVFAMLLLAFLAYATIERLDSVVDEVSIIINSREDNKKLISEDEIRMMLKKKIGYDITIANNGQLDLMALEKYLQQDNRIKKADIYLDKKNRVKIVISQKEPIVRIEDSAEGDFYLDFEGTRIPLVKDQIVRVPIVTGHVNKYQPNYKDDKEHNLNMVLRMAQKVSEDDFLSALVEQIHIDESDEIVLIPKMGRTKILFGQIDDLDEKVYKLKTYYRKGIKHIGIDKFDELNIKYEGQILGVTNT
ncbi:MAG: hypothetical protein HKN67_10375 [Saprospiraceae bacterium]|nr:hypothetical protein [Bacteroidia bacterium]NNF22341.1 hypothetical protein [Saprospiraceae bacterium]NNK90088.1 hypothetical protein [Saprospiraceae bacterium]